MKIFLMLMISVFFYAFSHCTFADEILAAKTIIVPNDSNTRTPLKTRFITVKVPGRDDVVKLDGIEMTLAEADTFCYYLAQHHDDHLAARQLLHRDRGFPLNKDQQKIVEWLESSDGAGKPLKDFQEK